MSHIRSNYGIINVPGKSDAECFCNNGRGELGNQDLWLHLGDEMGGGAERRNGNEENTGVPSLMYHRLTRTKEFHIS